MLESSDAAISASATNHSPCITPLERMVSPSRYWNSCSKYPTLKENSGLAVTPVIVVGSKSTDSTGPISAKLAIPNITDSIDNTR